MEIHKVTFYTRPLTPFEDLGANNAEVPTIGCWPGIFGNYCLKAQKEEEEVEWDFSLLKYRCFG